MRYYNCTKCQREHYEGTQIFADHIHFQSKHGIMRVREAYKPKREETQ